MKKPATPPGTAAAPLLHWLLVVAGLAVLTVLRIDEVETLLPLWVGSILGTGLGQLFAARRLRAWLAGFLIANAMWIGPLMLVPMWALLSEPHAPWMAVETSLMAFAPAAACGYFSLSERGALAAFWFPAVLWMLSILDTGSAALDTLRSYLLLAALVALLLAFLGARETRRVAFWQSHATVRLAEARRRVVLREQPLRFVGRLGWIAVLGGATLALTAWIAPHLWQKDEAESRAAAAPARAGEPVAGGEVGEPQTCCDESMEADVQRSRVREYLPIVRPHDREVRASVGQCVACRDGVPIRFAEPNGAAVASAGGHGGGTGAGDASFGGGSAPAPYVPGAATAAPIAPPGTSQPIATVIPTVATAAPTAPATAPPAPRPPVAVAARTVEPHRGALFTPAGARPSRGRSSAVVGYRPPALGSVEPDAGSPFGWLFAAALLSLAVNLGKRPLKRLLLLRHLDRPLWSETVDQRVSNLWQWMLIGLRDAGYRPMPGEQPQELARRVGLDGMKICATVLERARHGVRVDAKDLAAMSAAARSVYATARGRAGFFARAVSWMRWPLA
jgi:hypothetical protein